MTVLKAIAPLLIAIALITPIVTGFRRGKLDTFIWIGWGFLIFGYFSADLLIPTLAGIIYGNKAGIELTPNTPGTIVVMMFGWLAALFLHFIGFLLSDLVDMLRGLLSKARRH